MFVGLACVLIAVGRMQVRRARRLWSTGDRTARGRKARILGWSLSLIGLLLMVVGVVLW
jgi:hypothetical protein